MFTPTIKLEHADSRGEIYSITLPGNRELMLLHSSEGSMRGGHAHNVDEVVVILTGKVFYRKTSDSEDEEWTQKMMDGETIHHAIGEYHLAEFPEDSWLLEWKIGTDKNSWRNIDHEPYRAKVRANAAG